MTKEYRKPMGGYIGSDAKKLYQLEEKRNDAINAAAEELQKVLGLEDYWREAVPEALLSILTSYDKKAATLACEAFLAMQPKCTWSPINGPYHVPDCGHES